MPTNSIVHGSLFEENFLLRSLGPVVQRPDIAITELVANAWDAGASKVEITIPPAKGDKLIIEDNGIGFTEEEFKNRWMKLGYNRLKHQGDKVLFPEGKDRSRLAYGRNGIGRHGLLCFNDHYIVTSFKNGQKVSFEISTQDYLQPLVITKESCEDADTKLHGTRLEVILEYRCPDSDIIPDVISARFLHDPEFRIIINGVSVDLESHRGFINSAQLEINDDIKLEVLFFDTQKAAKSTKFQGVAFWQGGRLVGEPSWYFGGSAVVDGRIQFAKRYTFVVKTNDLAAYVNSDWTGFIKEPIIDDVFENVRVHVIKQLKEISKSQLEETKEGLKKKFGAQYSELSPLGKHEVDETVEHIVENHPTSTPEALNIAVEAIINLERSRDGRELLQKLAVLSTEDLESLNKILEDWTAKDAYMVLGEIDRRLNAIEAIDKLSNDPNIDELKTLHPLVFQSRWLFGAEYDSAEYASNRQLRTIAREILGVDNADDKFDNPLKRPDIFLFLDSAKHVTGVDEINHETGLCEFRRILIIELKRGGFNIDRAARDQATGYVEDFINCQSLTGNPQIFAFVVGHKISDKIAGKTQAGNGMGHIYTATYAQLVDTARKRFFNLRDKLDERYGNISGMELAQKTLPGM